MKKMDKKGFTLAELLIVVAIIAILVAISIPVFNSQLEKSRETSDTANLRAAKAAATVLLLDTTFPDGATTVTTYKGNETVFYYDIAEGVVKAIPADGVPSDAKCGKGTATTGNANVTGVLFTDGKNTYKATDDVNGKFIGVLINSSYPAATGEGTDKPSVQIAFIDAATELT